ncbi:hypothetical protein ACSTAY_18215 [Vreelandella alkaliphila]
MSNMTQKYVPFQQSVPDRDLFDIGDWPTAFIRFPELNEENRVSRLLTGLDCLLSQEEPFVAVWTPPSHDHDDEPHEDEKTAILWIKKHRDRLNHFCQGYVYVTQDEALRALLEERLKTVSRKLYQFPMKVVQTRQQASELAVELLGA